MLHFRILSGIVVLICFLILKERNFETRKNVFYFTSKGFVVVVVVVVAVVVAVVEIFKF